MGIISRLRQSVSEFFGGSEIEKVGVYGPPNAGKTTFTKQLIEDWTEQQTDDLSASEVPHETRKAEKRQVDMTTEHGTVSFEIVDTPGVSTSVNYEEFVKHDIDKEKAVQRSQEATEGVAEAMHWLREDIEGVVYVIDSTEDPFTQVNTMLVGLIESRDLPVVILANKKDKEDANTERVRNAFPQHPTVPVSALNGDNMEAAYSQITETFTGGDN